MNQIIAYVIIFALLVVLELAYFKIADRFNIIDKPNERSSHSTIVLRGGGIIFLLGLWIWFAFSNLAFGALCSDYIWFVLAVTLIAGVSFVDDITDLPDSLRLVVQFVAMALMFYQLGLFGNFGNGGMVDGIVMPLLIVLLALIVCVGASNIINFMDGINGITGAYAMASLIPLYIVNQQIGFVNNSLIAAVAIADVVFCFFNFRPKGKAKCFAGDVGSIGVAYILLFLIGSAVMKTQDITYLIFLLVYGVDGVLTICHRIMLHENLGVAHRKHAFQIMANELKIGHVTVTLIYMAMQLVVSLGFIGMTYAMAADGSSSDSIVMAHWLYLAAALIILAVAYVLFMRKFYHLHAEYLKTLDIKP